MPREKRIIRDDPRDSATGTESCGKTAVACRAATRPVGVSVRLLSRLLLGAALLSVAFSLFELQRTASYAHSLYALEQDRQHCDIAIQQLMDGSDYLTAQVQQYVVKGEREYMDNYWQEVHETRSRDNALQAILDSDITPLEREAAVAGKAESDALMQGEIWAMRMVSESIGIAKEDMPEEVKDYALSPADAAQSPERKKNAAIAFVFGPDYSVSKDTIRGNVNAFRNEIANRYAEEAISALARTERTTAIMSVALVAFFLLLIGSILCFARMVVSPLVGFSRELTRHEDGRFATLRKEGAREIRQFAAAFNALSAQVEQNTKRLERLGYIDYLTDVPNRASIMEYASGLIAEGKHPLGLMIVDIDNFKHFNDTYGHALGDQVLRGVAAAVCTVPPEGSGISGRLCGEEFIVVMRDADADILRNTAEAILDNVRRITAEDVRLVDAEDFGVTVSIGGMLWHGELPMDFNRMLSRADRALYASKDTGKDRYTFFGDAGKPA